MLTTIHITVRDRVPTITAGEDVISHNSDYVAEFEFDEEWQDKVKTVYFVCEDGSYQAVVMDGNSCGVPMLDGEHRRIFVGVQAGSAEKPSVLKTTRPCCLKVKDSIADYLGEQIPDPTPSVYEQIIAMLESITSPTWDAVQNKPFESLGDGLSVENGVLSAEGGSGGSPNAVQYVAQELTDEQKAQARENIEASPIPAVSTWKSDSYDDVFDLYGMGVGYGIVSGYNHGDIPNGMTLPALVIFGYMSYGQVTTTVYDGAGVVWRGTLYLSSGTYSDFTKQTDYVTNTALTDILQDYISSLAFTDALQKIGQAIGTKLDKNQGAGNAGKILGIGKDGNVVPQDKPSGGTVTVDGALSSTSENPVQNKVIKAELDKKIDNPQAASIGDVLTVEDVDGDGKPTKWKSVDANAILTIDNTGYTGTDYYALPDGVYNLLSLYVANKDGMNLRLQGVTSVKNHSFNCAEKNTCVIFGSDGSVVGYDYGVWRWSEKENVSNKVTSLSATSKDNQYPSAKAVYDALTTAIPKTLPNPHKLTFTGAVTGEYDGSSALTVDIPQGGDNSLGITTAAVGQIIKVKSVDGAGKPTEWEAVDMPSGDKWETVREITIPESVEGLSDGITYMLNDSGAIYALKFTTDANGNNLNYKKLHMLFMDFVSATQTTKDLGIIFNKSYISDNHVDMSGLVKNDSSNGVCDVECLGDNDGHTKVQYATLPMSGYGGYPQSRIMTPNNEGYGRNGFKAQSIVAIIMRSNDINVGIKPGGKIFIYGVRV